MTVAELIAVLQTLPPDARVVVQGYESGFNDATGAVMQRIVVNGGYRERDCLGPCVPVYQAGAGEHELPNPLDTPADVIEQAVFITSTRGKPA
jgi:hypothetical protein